jgi:hypothetical protein
MADIIASLIVQAVAAYGLWVFIAKPALTWMLQ